CVSIRILAKATTRARMAVPKIAPRFNFEIKTQAWPQQQPASVPIHITSKTTSNSSYQRLKPTKACAGRLDTLMTGYDPLRTCRAFLRARQFISACGRLSLLPVQNG